MKPDSSYRLVTLLCLLLVLPFAPALAQGEHSIPVAAAGQAAPQTRQSLPPEPDTDVTILRDDFAGQYLPATLPNLAKMYWRLGTFDMEDLEAVANYIKISECKLYADYVNDDLEWKEIVSTMRKHIEKARHDYPLDFQFVLPLRLGRYDPVLGGFPIIDKTDFKNAKRIEVQSVDRLQTICYDHRPIKDYPTNLIILLSKAFTLDFLKLDEHVAQAYILRKKSEYSALSPEQRLKSYEREAYLRLRITFSQYHGNVEGNSGMPMAIVYGNVDGYEIFEDAGQKRLMLSVENTNKEAPAMSVPAQPQAAPPAANVQTQPTQQQPAGQAPAVTPSP